MCAKRFNLTAQMVIRALVESWRRLQTGYEDTKRTFRSTPAIAYDDRILSFAIPDSSVSIWTMVDRAAIPFVCGTRQRCCLRFGMVKQIWHVSAWNWYMFATCEIDQPDLLDVEGVLGVDLGVTNIAVDSDGEVHSGHAITNVRYRHRRLRNKLQRKGTLGSHRRLWKLAVQNAALPNMQTTVSTRVPAETEIVRSAE